MKCKVCGEEIDHEIVGAVTGIGGIDLGKGKVICEECGREITKRYIKAILSETELGVVDTILEKLL